MFCSSFELPVVRVTTKFQREAFVASIAKKFGALMQMNSSIICCLFAFLAILNNCSNTIKHDTIL